MSPTLVAFCNQIVYRTAVHTEFDYKSLSEHSAGRWLVHMGQAADRPD